MASTTTPATSKDLLERVQRGWWEFLPLAWTIGERKMRERSASGWTYQEMLGHVAAWERITAARLARYRESGELAEAPADTDAFNANAAQAARAQPPSAALSELAEAHATVVSGIEALDDHDIAAHDGWVATIVANNTFGHYEEHRAELEQALPKTRDELVARLREDWSALRQLVAFVGDERLERVTPSGWTGKAMLAHLARWLDRGSDQISLWVRGERGAALDTDAENARVAREAASLRADEVVQHLIASYQGLLRALEALPEDVAVAPLLLRGVAGESFNHFAEHVSELHALRSLTSSELLARVEKAWRPVRERIREIGRARMGEQLPNGWTLKDLVGHLAAWEEYGEQGIREWRAGRHREMTLAEVDVFNAREVANRKLVGAEAIVDELDTAHRRLVAIIGTLTAEEVAERIPLALVGWDTYLHYPDHTADLGLEKR